MAKQDELVAEARDLKRINRINEAILLLEQATRNEPDAIDAWEELAELYTVIGNRRSAIAAFRRASCIAPGTARACFLAGRAFLEDRCYEEAEALLYRAISLDSSLLGAKLVLARSLQLRGEMAASGKLLDEAALQAPKRPDIFYAKMAGRKATEEDRASIEIMEALLSFGLLSLPDRRTLHFALGKAYDDLKDFARAIRHFNSANRAQKELRPPEQRFNARMLAFQVEESIKWFDRDRIMENAKLGSDSMKPIFIVGMQRSGTTLLEQMLSCHPEISAAGELGFLPGIAEGPFQLRKPNPAGTEIQGIADAILQSLEAVAGPEPNRVTEKSPGNSWFLGSLYSTFPCAKFIHCKRHPLDTCISIYTTSFMSAPFANDRRDLVVAYRQNSRIMDHWKAALPAGALLEVAYEDLVMQPEIQLPRILSFLELDWSEACMHHEMNENPIFTPSLWQARQPVYTSSIGRWKNYEPWLGELAGLI